MISHSSLESSSSEERMNFIAKTIVKLKAKRQAKKVLSALEEVKQIQQGKKTPKSLDEFLDEL